MKDLIWIEVSKRALQNNIRVLRRIIGQKIILAPSVKANAYGHGLAGTAKLILKYGADWLCVNSLDEAELLRRAGVKAPIILIGYAQKSDLIRAVRAEVRLFVYSKEIVVSLARLAARRGKKISVHIKVDTGMSRQGVQPEKIFDFISYIKKFPNLYIEGLATHFAGADEADLRSFRSQLEKFKTLIVDLKNHKIDIPVIHASGSAAVLLYPEARFKLVRPGLAIYGHYPSLSVKNICRGRRIKLIPSLTLKTKVAQIKEIERGTGVGYGGTFITKRKMKIAVLPIGYYDGLDRKLSNAGAVLIRGRRCPVLGRVSMNMTIVDVTTIKDIKPEDEAVIIGQQGRQEISAEEIADKIGTINYEVTTRLRESIKRYYK